MISRNLSISHVTPSEVPGSDSAHGGLVQPGTPPFKERRPASRTNTSFLAYLIPFHRPDQRLPPPMTGEGAQMRSLRVEDNDAAGDLTLFHFVKGFIDLF